MLLVAKRTVRLRKPRLPSRGFFYLSRSAEPHARKNGMLGTGWRASQMIRSGFDCNIGKEENEARVYGQQRTARFPVERRRRRRRRSRSYVWQAVVTHLGTPSREGILEGIVEHLFLVPPRALGAIDVVVTSFVLRIGIHFNFPIPRSMFRLLIQALTVKLVRLSGPASSDAANPRVPVPKSRVVSLSPTFGISRRPDPAADAPW